MLMTEKKVSSFMIIPLSTVFPISPQPQSSETVEYSVKNTHDGPQFASHTY